MIPSSRYRPGITDLARLEVLLVGQEKPLREALQVTSGEERRSLLLVGPRGAGKTHLLWVVYGRLLKEKSSGPLKIAFLDGEDWGAVSFLELLLRVLRALSLRELGSGLPPKIEAIYQEHPKHPERSLSTAKELLGSFVGEASLLLICEDLAGLFESLGEEGLKQWRSLLEEHPSWTILATSPLPLPGEPKHPFDGFFTVCPLAPLNAEQATELLYKKALLDQKAALADFLKTPEGKARVQAAHHLAGGQPRLYRVLSDFLTQESLDDLFGPLLQMLDALTPYYEAPIQRLAPLQRKIVRLLSQTECPITVKEVALRCLISHQSAAKQLGELAALGLLQKTPIGREVYCELADPLLRVCLAWKTNQLTSFRSFVAFVRRWFQPQGWKATPGMVQQLLHKQLDRIRLIKGPPTPQEAIMDYVDLVDPEAAAGLLAQTILEAFLPDVVLMMRVLRVTFEARQRGALSGLVLTSLAVQLLQKGGLADALWESALPELQAAFGDLEDCRISLQMMAAAHTYLRSKELAALLVLPLEQRALLLGVWREAAEG